MERMVLRRGASRADLDRFWDMLDGAGRNNVNVSALIDLTAVPERISISRWYGELNGNTRPCGTGTHARGFLL